MAKNDPLVTKSVLDTSLKKFSEDITGVINDFAERVDERFNDLELGQHRIERKLDQTVERVDDHSVRIEKIEQSAA